MHTQMTFFDTLLINSKQFCFIQNPFLFTKLTSQMSNGVKTHKRLIMRLIGLEDEN